MGATCLTLPSCALTWARSADLTNSGCRSWDNGSSSVVRCWPAGSSRPTSSPRWCRRCGGEAAPRDSVTRRLAHEPPGWRPTTLLLTIPRYAMMIVGWCRSLHSGRTPRNRGAGLACGRGWRIAGKPGGLRVSFALGRGQGERYRRTVRGGGVHVKHCTRAEWSLK